MNINDDLFYNIVQDFKKRDITTQQKGELIRAYIEEHKISGREFGRRFDIPHSTIQDYLSLRQKKKYHDLLHIQNNAYTIADRLYYLLAEKGIKQDDERLIRKLKELKIKIDEVLKC